MPELELTGYVIIGFSAFLVGLAKTGLPGVGILAVPLMAMAMPPRSSVGALLGILILGDLFAAGYYRRHAPWLHVLRLLPIAFCGIVAGYFALKVVNNEKLGVIIGVIVLAMLGINYRCSRGGVENTPVPTQWWFVVGIGLLAGLATMMANAAGPIMIIYLVAMRLPKFQFVGTAAWFFFLVNWVKVPFSANLQLMTPQSVKLDLMMLPLVAAGALAGIVLLKRVPQKVFVAIVQILAAAAAIKLLF